MPLNTQNKDFIEVQIYKLKVTGILIFFFLKKKLSIFLIILIIFSQDIPIYNYKHGIES